jgi:hypothetical protein
MAYLPHDCQRGDAAASSTPFPFARRPAGWGCEDLVEAEFAVDFEAEDGEEVDVGLELPQPNAELSSENALYAPEAVL